MRLRVQLFEVLAMEGVRVDVSTLEVSLINFQDAASVDKKKRYVGIGAGSSAVPFGDISSSGDGSTFAEYSSGTAGNSGGDPFASFTAPSPRIFRRAETARALLERDLVAVLGDILASPVSSKGQGQGLADVRSSLALSRAMFVQCSQLAGQLVILLRCLTASCQRALDDCVRKQKHAMATSATSSLFSATDNASLTTSLLPASGAASISYGALSVQMAPLLSATLILGRLAWLLKIRGRFQEEALRALY